jgi:hypothetical protein
MLCAQNMFEITSSDSNVNHYIVVKKIMELYRVILPTKRPPLVSEASAKVCG